MNAGDTILIPRPGTSYDSHLWMVISDPTQGDECVIVNFTSWRADKDQSCIVLPGEHSYIRNKTCVNFKDAKRCTISDLESLISSQHLTMCAPLSTGLLARIRQAVLESRMNWSCVQLLMQQSVVGAD
jgi:hypothetical protein